jgi:TonB family protein
MPSTLLRLAVALLAFGIGVTATMFWVASRTPDVKSSKFEPQRECIMSHVAPLPPLPTIEEPLPPPPPPPPLPATVYGGILNGKAISKPMPVYPAIARAARATGTVNVAITVDESGEVISAQAVSGHPLLQQAAVAAAREARFTPTRLSGQAVKVSGTISYNFVLQ